jgi:hypothetical protein
MTRSPGPGAVPAAPAAGTACPDGRGGGSDSPRIGTATGRGIAVIVPCLDEAATIGKVVADFRAVLPDAAIHVYDNGSTDGSADAARAAGAHVHVEPRRGKGRLLQRALGEIDARRYVIVDGDGTYDAAAAPSLLALVDAGADMAVASRRDSYARSTSRAGHDTGNRVLTRAVAACFGEPLRDVLSGYRVLERRFARTLPALATGFEVEIAMTLHALEIGACIVELESAYHPRASHSRSKLRTGRDGLRIVWTLLYLVKQVRPFLLFGTGALLFSLVGLALGVPVVVEFLATGLVPRFPTAILASALEVLAAVSLGIALVLDSIAAARRELKRIAFQSVSRATPLR